MRLNSRAEQIWRGRNFFALEEISEAQLLKNLRYVRRKYVVNKTKLYDLLQVWSHINPSILTVAYCCFSNLSRATNHPHYCLAVNCTAKLKAYLKDRVCHILWKQFYSSGPEDVESQYSWVLFTVYSSPLIFAKQHQWEPQSYPVVLFKDRYLYCKSQGKGQMRELNTWLNVNSISRILARFLFSNF